MLEKLRSRHPIDLPERYGHKVGILVILGGLAVLFVIVPLFVALGASLIEKGRIDQTRAALVAGGIGFLLLVVLVSGIRGKVGWDRR